MRYITRKHYYKLLSISHWCVARPLSRNQLPGLSYHGFEPLLQTSKSHDHRTPPVNQPNVKTKLSFDSTLGCDVHSGSWPCRQRTMYFPHAVSRYSFLSCANLIYVLQLKPSDMPGQSDSREKWCDMGLVQNWQHHWESTARNENGRSELTATFENGIPASCS